MPRLFSALFFFLLPFSFLFFSKADPSPLGKSPLFCIEEARYTRCAFESGSSLTEAYYEGKNVKELIGLPRLASVAKDKEFSSPLVRAGFSPFNNYLLTFSAIICWALGFFLCFSLIPVIKPAGRHESSERILFSVVSLLVLGALSALLLKAVAPPLPSGIDLYHDGIFLSAVTEDEHGKNAFQGSFFHYGPFYELLLPKFAKSLLHGNAIAGLRLTFHALHVTTLLTISFFIFIVTFLAIQSVGFISGTLLLLMLQGAHFLRWHLELYTDPREAVNALALCALGLFILRPRRSLTFAVAAIAFPFALFSVDRGVYYTLLLLCLALLMRKEISLRTLVFGFVSGAVFSASFFPISTFPGWLQNISSMNSFYEWMMSLPYPFLSQMAWEHSLLLFLLALCAAGGISLFLQAPAQAKGSREMKGLALLLGLAPLLYFRSVLARPDFHHVAYGSTYAVLGAVFFIWYWIQRSRRLTLGLIVFFVVLLNPLREVTSFTSHFSDWRKSMGKWEERFHTADSKFFNPMQAKAFAELDLLFSKEPCLSVFPSTPVLYHVLAKPGCSRFHVSTFASPQRFQLEWIQKMEIQKPRRIIYASPYSEYNSYDDIPITERLPLVNAYILENYQEEKNVDGWLVYSRKTI
jgi:hypothetical protein